VAWSIHEPLLLRGRPGRPVFRRGDRVAEKEREPPADATGPVADAHRVARLVLRLERPRRRRPWLRLAPACRSRALRWSSHGPAVVPRYSSYWCCGCWHSFACWPAWLWQVGVRVGPVLAVPLGLNRYRNLATR